MNNLFVSYSYYCNGHKGMANTVFYDREINNQKDIMEIERELEKIFSDSGRKAGSPNFDIATIINWKVLEK